MKKLLSSFVLTFFIALSYGQSTGIGVYNSTGSTISVIITSMVSDCSSSTTIASAIINPGESYQIAPPGGTNIWATVEVTSGGSGIIGNTDSCADTDSLSGISGNWYGCETCPAYIVFY